jgi:transcriptional regulator with XRE-family HTH domain
VTAVDRQPPSHNNSTCVKWHNCHRPECRDRYNTRRRAIRAGTLQPRTLIDATPIRQHILDLQEAGLTPTRIARLAGMSHTNITDFLHASPSQGRGRKQQTTPEIAAKILAVQPLTTAGTFRRIQALVAIGWPVRQIAARANVSARWIVNLHPDTVVNLVTARKIAAAYEELQNLNPEKHGVWPGHASRAKKRAKANRWPPPKYWAERMDVMDDPHFEPMYGRTRGELLAADARELFRYGIRIEQVAERLGVTRNHIQQELLRHPDTEKAAA